MLTKQSRIIYFLIVSLMVTSLNLVTARQVLAKEVNLPTIQTNSAKQIYFAVKGGTFTYVEIEGLNQNGSLALWPYSNTNKYGAVLTTNYWWQGTIRITVDIVNVGRRSCLIENLKTGGNQSYTIVIYDVNDLFSCGRSSTASTVAVPPLKAYFQLEEVLQRSDAWKVSQELKTAVDVVKCTASIVIGMKSPNVITIVGKGCRGIANSVVEAVLKNYGKKFVVDP